MHSIDLFEPANTVKLHHLLREVGAQASGIDVAIACANVTGHRTDVLDRDVEHISSLYNVSQTDGEPPYDISNKETSGARHPRLGCLQVIVAADQEFILRSWEQMRARRLGGKSTARPSPKIVVLSSSTAFFTPASFALYVASKAYLYSLARSLQIASGPYGISVVTVTPGFMETGMTATMSEAGVTLPTADLGNPRKSARKIRDSEEKDELVVFHAVLQVWLLYALGGLNSLLLS
jgi:NAD(P)-dependent dehydrogenase (short-subunit alcohol dehydrogenase family)